MSATVQSSEGVPQGALYNADLAPTTAAQRTWTWYHFAALWVGMVMCIPSYTLAAGLIDQGMSPWQAVSTVLLGVLAAAIVACALNPLVRLVPGPRGVAAAVLGMGFIAAVAGLDRMWMGGRS